MMRILPWAGAWLTSSAALVLLMVGFAPGQNPAAALVYGWLGVAGHGGYAAVAMWLRRRRAAGFDEELAAHFLSTPREDPNDGLARLHADLRNDEARRYHLDQDHDDRP